MARFSDTAEFLAFKALQALLAFVPRSLCLRTGRVLGLFFFYLDRKHRLTALDNLQTAFGKEKPSPELRTIARKSFMHFGMLLMDLVKFPSLDQKRKEALLQVEGEEHLDSALRKNKGVLLFTAHFGNWEMGPSFVSRKGTLNVIARPLDNRLLEKELSRLRAKQGARVIPKHQAAKQILHSLRRKEMVAFLIDQNVQRHQAVFVDFFGKRAATTPSLAAFHIKSGAPLVPIFCFPAPSRRIAIRILEPLEIPLAGDYFQQVLKITRVCTKMIEDRVRENPEFWLWFHKRWKTRPENENHDRGTGESIF